MSDRADELQKRLDGARITLVEPRQDGKLELVFEGGGRLLASGYILIDAEQVNFNAGGVAGG